jgi:spore maturation protein CgeB
VPESINLVFIGLAITSSWGNGHASTYRSLLKGLHQRGHRVLFLERDQPWYASHRDAPELPYCETRLYASTQDLRARFAERIRAADAVIVGSYVDDGAQVCEWVLEHAGGARAFYDIDTPVTLTSLRDDRCPYLRAEQIPEFDLMFSFTGGPTLQHLQDAFGARRAAALYCSVDTDEYRPQACETTADLGYLGTYSADRQPSLEAFLNGPARQLPQRRFSVAGAQYPPELSWPANVERIQHLPPQRHPQFYARQRFALNLTRADMRRCGYSPSVRLFEAAACGTPIISDHWPGLDEFLTGGEQILIAHQTRDVVGYLEDLSEAQRQRIAEDARERVVSAHSGVRRATELECHLETARRYDRERVANDGTRVHAATSAFMS